MTKFIYKAFMIIVAIFCASCSLKKDKSHLQMQELFSLQYGNFEDEINLFDLAETKDIATFHDMHDGLFYIANGRSHKIMVFGSYGDLLKIYYNNEIGVPLNFGNNSEDLSTKTSTIYPFNTLGYLKVAKDNSLYVADTLPQDEILFDSENKQQLKTVILHFTKDGKFENYLGQQGPGGTPFPYICDMYCTDNNCLVVVCVTPQGHNVYWFSPSLYLMYEVPITAKAMAEFDTNAIITVDKIIPDMQKDMLYIKLDRFCATVDNASHIQTGLDYKDTIIVPFDIEKNAYSNSLEIPPYTLQDSTTQETVQCPYNLLGITKSGKMFFVLSIDTGYALEVVDISTGKIIKRHLDFNHAIYQHFSLSTNGIISAILARDDCMQVVWWLPDKLLE